MIIWPIGCPLVYAVLIWSSREAIRTGISTSLSGAIAFLTDDCTLAALEPSPSDAAVVESSDLLPRASQTSLAPAGGSCSSCAASWRSRDGC